MANIIQLYSEYQHNKWFPKTYPDPFGELIDYINEEEIRRLVEQSKKSGNRGLLQIAFELSELLPSKRFRDAYSDYASVYEKKIAPAQCRPEFSYFHLRKLQREERTHLWNNLQDWAESAKTRMLNWHAVRIQTEKTLKALRDKYQSVYGLQSEKNLTRIERWLLSTKEEFDFEFERYSDAKTLPEALASFRLSNWDLIFDWNDFPELGRSLFKIIQIEKTPQLRKSELDPGLQACLAVFPPNQVIIEYGAAAGPCDSTRFIAEASKGCFYSNMNSEIPEEFRFSGDPRISDFWRNLFVLGYTSKTGLQKIVGDLAVDLSTHLKRFISFWIRYDAFLALYKNSAERDLQTAEDSFAENWRKAFTLDVPARLYLFELDRASSALARVQGMEAAVHAHEKLRTVYGNAWLSSSQCISRLKDFWREGFKLSLNDVLEDLNIKVEEDFHVNF
jgi:hypothetical protein